MTADLAHNNPNHAQIGAATQAAARVIAPRSAVEADGELAGPVAGLVASAARSATEKFEAANKSRVITDAARQVFELAQDEVDRFAIAERLGLSVTRVEQIADKFYIRLVPVKAGETHGERNALVEEATSELGHGHVSWWASNFGLDRFGLNADEDGDQADPLVLDPAKVAELDPSCAPTWLARLDATIADLQRVRNILASVAPQR